MNLNQIVIDALSSQQQQEVEQRQARIDELTAIKTSYTSSAIDTLAASLATAAIADIEANIDAIAVAGGTTYTLSPLTNGETGIPIPTAIMGIGFRPEEYYEVMGFESLHSRIERWMADKEISLVTNSFSDSAVTYIADWSSLVRKRQRELDEALGRA